MLRLLSRHCMPDSLPPPFHLRYHIVTTTVRLSTIRNILHFCRIVATTLSSRGSKRDNPKSHACKTLIFELTEITELTEINRKRASPMRA